MPETARRSDDRDSTNETSLSATSSLQLTIRRFISIPGIHKPARLRLLRKIGDKSGRISRERYNQLRRLRAAAAVDGSYSQMKQKTTIGTRAPERYYRGAWNSLGKYYKLDRRRALSGPTGTRATRAAASRNDRLNASRSPLNQSPSPRSMPATLHADRSGPIPPRTAPSRPRHRLNVRRVFSSETTTTSEN